MSVSQFFSKFSYFLFLGILLANLYQKKYGKRGERKRFATLYMGIAVFVVFLASGAIIHSEQLFGTKLNDLLILPVVAGAAAYVYAKREKTLPFRFRCAKCGARLPAEKAFFIDGDLCASCEAGEK